MKTSNEGIELIKRFEGLHLKSYRCSANVLTIGWGSTGKHVTEDLVITRDEAEELLKSDLLRFERGVSMLCGKLEQNQFDALVSFAFNLGLGALQRSTLRQKVLRGQDMEAALEFMKWVRAGGKVLSGLLARRTAESRLYVRD